MTKSSAKKLGQFFTPRGVASTLIRWVVRDPGDRLLDPSCGDGSFISQHRNSVGVDLSEEQCHQARSAAPHAKIYEAEFFSWASQTHERFECIAGNPPFIRYQNFDDSTKTRALNMCVPEGAKFSALTSSWAPFIVVAGSLLRPGGRMAFIVPAEIGHSTYAVPLLNSLVNHFERVVVVAIKKKIFPKLSEDVWLLYADGRGGRSQQIEMATWEQFEPTERPPAQTRRISLDNLAKHGNRLRKFLLPDRSLERYYELAEEPGIVSFGSIAQISIGYVTGANDFFHLKPSDAERLGIPREVLRVAVRKGEQLPERRVDRQVVRSWLVADEQILLLDLSGVGELPDSVKSYLNTKSAHKAKQSYKCSNRDPWYVVPDVYVPNAFLSYMSGKSPNLVSNPARCVCTNSVHAVRLHKPVAFGSILNAWRHPICDLSKEIEGHPLGGGLLKLEPGEASRILLPLEGNTRNGRDADLLEESINILRSWRHCG